MNYYVTPEKIETKGRQWLGHISPINTREMHLNPARSALVVVNMQRFFLDPASPSFTCGDLAIIPNLKILIQPYRSRGLPVIYTRHVHHLGLLDAGIMAWWSANCRNITNSRLT